MNTKLLRQKILDLAIRGKLVPQDKNDGDAKDLLYEIKTEKAKLIKEGKIKKEKPSPEIVDSEKPFEIPKSWCWCRQSNICWLSNGEVRTGEKLPYLEVKVIRGIKKPNYINSGVMVDSSQKLIIIDGENSGEVMIPLCKGYMGSTFRILSATSFIDYKYLEYIFLLNKEKYRNSKTGSAIPHLDKKLFRDNLIPIPPLAEQKRIVDKINKLFAQIDIIEEALKDEVK